MQDIQQETIGHRIRLRGRELGYSQREIAGLLGFSKNHLSSIENGRTGLSLDKFVELCNILRVFPDYLYWGHCIPIISLRISSTSCSCAVRRM